jgi:hypothetical protein
MTDRYDAPEDAEAMAQYRDYRAGRPLDRLDIHTVRRQLAAAFRDHPDFRLAHEGPHRHHEVDR